jgi:hypothetical protein
MPFYIFLQVEPLDLELVVVVPQGLRGFGLEAGQPFSTSSG